MSALHLVYHHWFITCLLLWAATAGAATVIRALKPEPRVCLCGQGQGKAQKSPSHPQTIQGKE